jgi:hypothetical protein
MWPCINTPQQPSAGLSTQLSSTAAIAPDQSVSLSPSSRAAVIIAMAKEEGLKVASSREHFFPPERACDPLSVLLGLGNVV